MKLFESLYTKVFVSIVIGKSSTTIYIESYASKGSSSTYEESFNTLTLDEKMLQFINTHINETPFYYISVLDPSSSQGALPTCDKEKLAYYHDDILSCKSKCQNTNWTHYTLKSDLHEIQKTYSSIGVDFIFSPFSVLARFFKDKIDGEIAVFVLVQETFLSVSIFNHSELVYAQQLDIVHQAKSEELEEINTESDLEIEDDDAIDLDSISVDDDLSALDDFSDIEDLDALDDIDEFSQNEDFEEELHESEEIEKIEEQESDDFFNEDYLRFSLIQNMINSFYKDMRYKSEFLENIYIADAVGITGELKNYFEEEMYMNVYIRQIALADVVSELATAEVDL